MKLSPGLKIIWIELALIYFIPWFINVLIDFSFVGQHHIYDHHLVAFFFIIGFASLLLLFDLRQKREVKPRVTRPMSKSTDVLRFTLAVFFLGVGISGYLSGLNSFRNAAESAFKDGTATVYFFAFLPYYFKFDLLFRVFYELPDNRRRTPLVLVTQVISAIAFLFGVNGVATGLLVCLYFFFVISPTQFRVLFTKSGHIFRELSKYFAIGGMTLVIIGLGWFIGEASKFGGTTNSLMERITDPEFFETFITWGLYRISITYYSFLYSLHHFFLVFDTETLQNLLIPIDNLKYRVDILLGDRLGFPKPIISSIARLNCELVSTNCGAREGTSPGFLASFLMTFPIPFNLGMLTAFALAMKSIYSRLVLRMNAVPNLPGLVVIWWIVSSPLATPIDMLTFIDETFVSFLVILFFAYDWSPIKYIFGSRPSLKKVRQREIKGEAMPQRFQPSP